MAEEIEHKGGCHCGKVKFIVKAPAEIDVVQCNCSICTMKGFLHLFATKDQFSVQGSENLSTYSFGTHTAKHYFCKTCGIASYYIPRSHPNGYSINVNCLDHTTIKNINIKQFDGRDSYEEQLSSIN